MENLCAIFLDKKGRAKRMPWRKMPVPLELNDEEIMLPSDARCTGR